MREGVGGGTIDFVEVGVPLDDRVLLRVADPVRLIVGVGDPVRLELRLLEPLRVGVGVGVPDRLGVCVALWVGVVLVVGVGGREGVPVALPGDGVPVGGREALALPVAVGRAVRVAGAVPEEVPLAGGVALWLPLGEGVDVVCAVRLLDCVLAAEVLTLAVEEGVPDEDDDPEAEALGEGVGLLDRDAVGGGVRVRLPVCVRVGLSVVGAVAVGERLRDAVGVPLLLPLPVGSGVPLTLPLGEGELLLLPVPLEVGLLDREAVAVLVPLTERGGESVGEPVGGTLEVAAAVSETDGEEGGVLLPLAVGATDGVPLAAADNVVVDDNDVVGVAAAVDRGVPTAAAEVELVVEAVEAAEEELVVDEDAVEAAVKAAVGETDREYIDAEGVPVAEPSAVAEKTGEGETDAPPRPRDAVPVDVSDWEGVLVAAAVWEVDSDGELDGEGESRDTVCTGAATSVTEDSTTPAVLTVLRVAPASPAPTVASDALHTLKTCTYAMEYAPPRSTVHTVSPATTLGEALDTRLPPVGPASTSSTPSTPASPGNTEAPGPIPPAVFSRATLVWAAVYTHTSRKVSTPPTGGDSRRYLGSAASSVAFVCVGSPAGG